jgi:hypothetical protein
MAAAFPQQVRISPSHNIKLISELRFAKHFSSFLINNNLLSINLDDDTNIETKELSWGNSLYIWRYKPYNYSFLYQSKPISQNDFRAIVDIDSGIKYDEFLLDYKKKTRFFNDYIVLQTINPLMKLLKDLVNPYTINNMNLIIHHFKFTGFFIYLGEIEKYSDYDYTVILCAYMGELIPKNAVSIKVFDINHEFVIYTLNAGDILVYDNKYHYHQQECNIALPNTEEYSIKNRVCILTINVR